jgi:hypothetical protein
VTGLRSRRGARQAPPCSGLLARSGIDRG